MAALPLRRRLLLWALLALGCRARAPQHPPDPAETVILLDVSIVPMTREGALGPQTVVLHDGKIWAIGTSADTHLPRGAHVIDGRGRYLMPGLVDTDVALEDERFLALLLSFGVTAVRDRSGEPQVLLWRDEIATGRRLGPRLHPTRRLDPNDLPAGLEQTLQEAVRQGYRLLELPRDTSGEAHRTVAAGVRGSPLRLVGPVPAAVGLGGALAAGQTCIEGLSGFAEAIESESSPLRGLAAPWIVATGLRFAYADEARIPPLVTAIGAAGAWGSLGLVAFDKMAHAARGESMGAAPELALVTEPLRAAWHRATEGLARKLDPKLLERARVVRETIAKRLANRLLAGTGAPRPYVVPGYAIHEELEAMVAAGLTPYEALRAATLLPAHFLGVADSVGTVEVGKRADLLLVEDNPLEDIKRTRNLVGIFLQGHWLPRAELDEMRAGAAGAGVRSAEQP